MFCWLQVLKVRETRPMGHKLTCGTNLTSMFQDFTGFNPYLIIFSYNLVTYAGHLTTEQTGPWL